MVTLASNLVLLPPVVSFWFWFVIFGDNPGCGSAPIYTRAVLLLPILLLLLSGMLPVVRGWYLALISVRVIPRLCSDQTKRF